MKKAVFISAAITYPAAGALASLAEALQCGSGPDSPVECGEQVAWQFPTPAAGLVLSCLVGTIVFWRFAPEGKH